MQRVSSFLPGWDRRTSSTKSGLFGWSNRSSSASQLAKINVTAANASRVQRESLWPATLDLECDKAARILKTFCTDGYLASPEDLEPSPVTNSEPKSPIKVLKKIPKRILQNAAGIAVFTCMRSGLWMTGSGGSGILIARKSDGTWSPPSGIMLHTPTLSFIIGVDVYDCVLVISNLAALEAITRPSVTLGEDIGLTAGPSIPLGSDDIKLDWKDLGNTVLTYMKARGQLQTVNLTGSILTERANENERFYSSNITQMDILAGNVDRPVEETTPLFEVIKMAEGRSDYDAALVDRIAMNPAPGDAVIASPQSASLKTPRTAFGVPNADDPDPFGVLALEMAGLEIREAGTQLRPVSSQFDLNRTPVSPAFSSKFNRQSVDTLATRSNRGSYMSSRTSKSQTTDVGTQTRTGGANTPLTTPSPGQSEDGNGRSSFEQISKIKEEQEVDYTKVDSTLLQHLSQSEEDLAKLKSDDARDEETRRSVTSVPTVQVPDSADPTGKAGNHNNDEDMHDADDEEDEEDIDDEEPVIFEVASVQPAKVQAVASRMIPVKGNMVTIPKRIPPPLPLRSPARASRSSKSEMGGEVSHLRSPLVQSFSESDLQAAETSPRKSVSSLTAVDGLQVETVNASESTTKASKSEELNPASLGSMASEQRRLRLETPATGEMKKAHEEVDLTSSQRASPEALKDDAASISAESIYSQEQAEHSDAFSNNKYTPSLYTGTTEDRSSYDGSSLTTPTSDRPYSVVEELEGEDTPKREVKEVIYKEYDQGKKSQVAKLKAAFECKTVAA
ncbi:hypothetical protein S7711_03517 [Stachybotrys chartarum IBT 7711]|uniref:Ysc84 actin-binding domain-containing protein n=1 Tax=Stachybotrys chartarum (strain CBS 109288 / IBT 7711) TaxID=1280523 RepID=A0A084B1M1_STACB|nr:hypothetical protein S7711_03517 [Stachybotrys chartarum IBT 7711]KFA72753.1 hypothetical protein S40288_06139 [Stachybotrys chartarum IBT 40288]